MKILFNYYVLDPIMESIVGSFTAPNDNAAMVVFKKSIVDNEKFKSYGNSLVVYKNDLGFELPETFSEIVDLYSKEDLYGRETDNLESDCK